MRSRSGSTLLVLAALGAAGCQSYSPRPLDTGGHLRAWDERSPASPEVADLAKRLAAPAATPAAPAADALTLADAEIVALVFSPDLRLARLKAGVAEAAAGAAGLWEDPVFSADIARFVNSTANPWRVMASVGFTLPISGRLNIEKQRAGAEHATELARVYEAEWRTRIDLRRAWREWSAESDRAALAAETVGSLKALTDIVGRIEAAGEMSRLEASLFRQELAMRQAELAVAEAARDVAGLAIRQLMGLAPGAPLTFKPEEAPGHLPKSVREQLADTSPALAVSRTEYEVAERTLQLEVRKQYPDLMVGPGFGREDGMNQVLLGVSLPLPVLNANRQAIAQARARREVARASFETLLERLHAEAAAAEVALSAATARHRIISDEVAPLAERQYADALKTAELGEVDTFLLLETLTRRQGARARLIDARLGEALARLRLEALVGPAPEEGRP